MIDLVREIKTECSQRYWCTNCKYVYICNIFVGFSDSADEIPDEVLEAKFNKAQTEGVDIYSLIRGNWI